MKLTRNTNVHTLLQNHVQLYPVFWRMGIYIAGNPVQPQETIEQVCAACDVEPEALLERLRAASAKTAA